MTLEEIRFWAYSKVIWVRCGAWPSAPGGTWLASGGADKTVRLWNVPSEIDRWNRIEALFVQRALEQAARERATERKAREDRVDGK
jgi:hypothetical protein